MMSYKCNVIVFMAYGVMQGEGTCTHTRPRLLATQEVTMLLPERYKSCVLAVPSNLALELDRALALRSVVHMSAQNWVTKPF